MTLFFYILIGICILPLLIGVIALVTLSRGRSSPGGRIRTCPIPVLLFHSVTEASSVEQSTITKVTLEQLLSYLHTNGYTTRTVYDTAQHPEESGDSPQVALIFDDGFENFYTLALPLFAHHACKASIFPVVNSLDTYSSWDTYAPQKQLSKEQVRLIAEAGHEIGSHTLTHPDLVLLSEKDLLHELSESKKILEDITGKAITSLSFPFGSWNKRVWQCAQECGYKAAVAYRKHRAAIPPILPATGVYAFDTCKDIIEKIEKKHTFSNTSTRSAIMPHFAKGTPMWKFRGSYDIVNFFRQ